MKAVQAHLLKLLGEAGTQFVVPIYQRVYSWDQAECERLWSDILRAGKSDSLGEHFTGSIVYVERDEGTKTSAEPDLIIDGQQRVTTATLILAALAARLEQLPENEREPVEGFSPKKIRNRYLINDDEDSNGDRYFKLVLSQADRDALKSVIRNAPVQSIVSRVNRNYQLFVARLTDPRTDLVAVCNGLRKLVIVDVKLTRGVDKVHVNRSATQIHGYRAPSATDEGV